jgi:hypothetical protein
MSYTNLNNPANYQLQSFGQDGMRTISTTQAYVEGEYYRVLVATEDSTLSATSMVGDDLASIDVYAGTTIYGLFTAVTVTAGEVTAYLAGRTDIDDVWAYIRAYGVAGGATIEGEDCAKAAISPLLDKYYAKASLVMVPSLYKTSIVYSERPLSTDGQLTFSRASSATRVGPDGYVEKVRTNLLLQSNSFDTTWTTTNSSVTSGQSGYDGSSDAWLLESTGASGSLRQSISSSGVLSYSFYAKAGNVNYVRLRLDAATETNAWFLLSGSGSVGTLTNGISSSIESVGGGWYRVSVNANATSLITIRVYPSNINAGGNSSGDNVYIQNAQLETGDIATDYIPTTTVAVSVGPVANLPRLNYPINSDGSVGCPSLLLEPQRTNSLTYSEQFDNAAWGKVGVTISANTATSPNGYFDSDVVQSTTASTNDLRQNITFSASTNYSYSFFLKGGTSEQVRMQVYDGSSFFRLEVNPLNSFAVVDEAGLNSYLIEDYGNGWSRVIMNFTTSAGAGAGYVQLYPDRTGDLNNVISWGAQLEAGAYATSYIPTLGATVTRGADACSKTGISSLIGQTEGTLFAEVGDFPKENNGRVLCISDGTTSNYVIIFKNGLNDNFNVLVLNGGVAQVSFNGTGSLSNNSKIAVGYANNDCAIYVNGNQVHTDTSASVPTCSNVYVGQRENGSATFIAGGSVAQALLFKTRLSNAQLAELTTL